MRKFQNYIYTIILVCAFTFFVISCEGPKEEPKKNTQILGDVITFSDENVQIRTCKS